MNRADRRREQAELEVEYERQQHARQERHVALPAPGSPEYCPVNMRGHRHFFHKNRCIWCEKRRGQS